MSAADHSGEWWYAEDENPDEMLRRVYRVTGDVPGPVDKLVGRFADPADAAHAAACVTVVGGLIAAGMWDEVREALGHAVEDAEQSEAELRETDGPGRMIQ